MQIITGQFKGRKIKTRSGMRYRPTTGLIRKSVFDIIGPLSGKSFLDLFAGSGIMGFEALSRGAAPVSLIERDRKTVYLLRENADRLGAGETQIIAADVFRHFRRLGQWDIIFADPPYGQVDLEALIPQAVSHLTDDGIFVLESSGDDKLPPGHFREKRVGGTSVTFWEKQNA